MTEPQGHSGDGNARGLWIAFFGPDGVGKSAVIERLEENLAGAFCGCRRFHFRPRLGRRDVDRTPVTAPHGQSPRGLLLSLCKLVYWLLDCWLGYLVRVSPNTRRSRLVVFDRYLPDMLVDPVRYRLPSSAMRFAAAIVRLAPQPDLYVLLDAPAEIVQQRKREVSLAESQRQRLEYLNRFRSLPAALVVNADYPVAAVAENVASAIRSFMVHFPRPQKAALVANLRLD